MASTLGYEVAPQKGHLVGEQGRSRQARSIKVWAFVGVLWLGLGVFEFGRWLFGGLAKATPVGVDPVPTYMKIGILGWYAFFVGASVIALYWWVYRPWKRDRQMPNDAFLLLAMSTMWVQDPWMNFFKPFFSYNTYTPNFGCPQCFAPGFTSNGTYMAENFMALGVYIGFLLPCVLIGCKIMRRVANRWPRSGPAGPIIAVIVAAFIFDFVTEILWVIPGVYSYIGGEHMPGPVLFAGEYYQLPVFMVGFAALWYTGFVAFRYFRNDRGQTFVERGVESLRGTNRQRSGVRLLALIGGLNVVVFVLYNGPLALAAKLWGTNSTGKFASYWAPPLPPQHAGTGATAIALVLVCAVVAAGAWFILRSDRAPRSGQKTRPLARLPR
jgi:hypothetical protein